VTDKGDADAMRANYLHLDVHAREVLAAGVRGDFAEIGVWHGYTFVPLAELARQAGRVIHAVDSWRGMASPTAADGDEYAAGALSTGGSVAFREAVRPFRNVRIHEGWVPDILAGMATRRFAFVHVDLDQFRPTLEALRFFWPRLSTAGRLMVHDYFPGRQVLASFAVSAWCRETGIAIAGVQEYSRHCWFVKA